MTEANSEIVNQAIAGRVHQYRKAHHLSLDELAKRAEISKGMLVQIEKGRANPSIGILCKLANALKVSVADIVNVSIEPKVAVIKGSDIPVLWRGENGGQAKLLAGTKGPTMVELWRWEMQPGEVFSAEAHSKGTIELFHVEQGALTMTVDNKDYCLDSGDAMVAQTDVPHHYANTSQDITVFTLTVYEVAGS